MDQDKFPSQLGNSYDRVVQIIQEFEVDCSMVNFNSTSNHSEIEYNLP